MSSTIDPSLRAPIAPPQYVRQVESLVGMALFSDQQQHETFVTQPHVLEHTVFEPRAALYRAGLRALAETRRSRRATTDQAVGSLAADKYIQVHELAEPQQQAVRDIRSGLMILDPELQTPKVRRLQSALAAHEERVEHTERQRRPTPRTRTPKNGEHQRKKGDEPDVLPAHLIPVRAVEALSAVEAGITLQSNPIKHARSPIAVKKLKLPGPGTGEICCNWEIVRELVDKYGYAPGVEPIDFDRLPQHAGDRDPGKIAYAREVQLAYVRPHKLINIPELATQLSDDIRMPSTAKPHHISRSALKNIMGGGYHFIEPFCQKNNIPLLFKKRPDSFGVSEYLRLEDAAEVWDAYQAIPPAEPHEITLASICKRTGLAKSVILAEMTDEEKSLMASRRALSPKGRVLRHVPDYLAADLVERTKIMPLPANLITIEGLEARTGISYSGIMQHMSKRPELLHLREVVRPKGASSPIVCVDWEIMQYFEKSFGMAPGSTVIDYADLPTYPEDSNPDRVAYARAIQKRYVAPKIMEGVLGEDTAEAPATAEQNAGEPHNNASVELPQSAEIVTIPAMPETHPDGTLVAGAEALVENGAYDAPAISKLTRLPLREVETAIATTDLRGCVPPQSIYNPSLRIKTPHYSVQAASRVLNRLVGIRIEELSAATGFTIEAVRHLLEKRHYQPGKRYAPSASAELFKLLPPRGFESLAPCAKKAGMNINDALLFVRSHYGNTGTYLNSEGAEEQFIDELAANILEARAMQRIQRVHFEAASEEWYDRRRIADITGAPNKIFEQWFRDRKLVVAPTEQHMRWLENASGDVLPYFHHDYVRRYLRQYQPRTAA